MSKTTQQIVTQLTNELLRRGVLVDIYPSKTTSSFYLLFDNGVLKAARVGDHRGKPKYNYTYEIGKHIKLYDEYEQDFAGKKFTRYRYPSDDIQALITQILVLRASMKSKYGAENYQQFTQRIKQGPFDRTITQYPPDTADQKESEIIQSLSHKLLYLIPQTELATTPTT